MRETIPEPHRCERCQWETLDDGPPRFHTNRQMWWGERAHVRCRLCGCRTFITREEWNAQHPSAPVRLA